jgi:hypothetical protein
MRLEGGCLCGSVRYEITGSVVSVGLCHCRTCRLAAGATPVGWAVCAQPGFRWVAGQPVAYASSPGVLRTHCGSCGTPLTYADDDKTIDITIATLDDPEALVPGRETWLDHRVAWAAVDPKRMAFPQGSTNQQ